MEGVKHLLFLLLLQSPQVLLQRRYIQREGIQLIDSHHGIDIHNNTSRCFWANAPSSSSNFIINSWKIQYVCNRSLQLYIQAVASMFVFVFAQPYAPFSVLPASLLLCLSVAAWGEQTPALSAWPHTPAEGKTITNIQHCSSTSMSQLNTISNMYLLFFL